MTPLHFRPSQRSCPICDVQLKAYKTTRKTVRSGQVEQFEAVDHLKICPVCQEVFRSERLAALVPPRCTYANDVMVEVANLRFLEGRSCREIAQHSETGISERHARRLSNMALTVLEKVHERSSEALRATMGKWVLQIDGTVDGDYEMIVAVRDATSGFLLYGKRCHFETHDEIMAILRTIKERYGSPCVTMSDMRAGILSALAVVFPEVPVAICWYHFLRDLGKDLTEKDHTSLAKIFRTYGIRTALKSALQALPKYKVELLREVGDGYCSNPTALSEMECRRALERVLSVGERSGLGFPFTLRHLNFLEECLIALPVLVENNQVAQNPDIEEAVLAIREVVNDQQVMEIRERLKEVYGLFSSLREAMYPEPKGTPLSGESSVVREEAHLRCGKVIAELDKALEVLTPGHVSAAAKKIVTDYRKREGQLFPEGLEGVVLPTTNNGMEQVFRRMRRNVRKRIGDKATGRQLTLTGEQLLLYQNLTNPAYVKAVFGEEGIVAVFGRERTLLPTVPLMRRKDMERLLDKGQELLRVGKIPETPYGEEVFVEAQLQRQATSLPETPLQVRSPA